MIRLYLKKGMDFTLRLTADKEESEIYPNSPIGDLILSTKRYMQLCQIYIEKGN